MKKNLAFLLCGMMLITGCSNNPANEPSKKSDSIVQYQNPVFTPVIADPTIIKGKDDYFYIYGTEENWGDGNGPRYVPVIKSKDLINWKYLGEAFEAVKKPDWKEGGIWAPDIAYYQDRYLLYYALSTWGDPDPGIGVAVSDKPEGPFRDAGPLFRSGEIGVENSIDPAFFVDNGTPYLFWGSFHGIYGIQLANDGLHINGKPFQVAGTAFEAPYLMRKNGYYYLFLSLGSCCEGEDSTYRVAVGRSKKITGPYIDQKGKNIMTSEGTLILKGSKTIAGPGHNTIMTDKEGTDWIIYHGIEKKEPKLLSGATRRPLFIDRIHWKDGWPVINHETPSKGKQNGPKF
ncbi:family 43 glycosylhydrolase [Bacillus rubiinfantis]|uniref:family 43 glycosylhydrolase n=1 Tax=Bacillus rubiinfantis TaxID=1499680 RepID=UPI0005A7ED83|nr:family 43 glycosylhydrolase [Bacillus rubiinfantis]